MDMAEVWAVLREESTASAQSITESVRNENAIQNAIATERPRLLDQVRRAMRVAHYAIRTEDAYIDWIRRYILFHNKRHPAVMGAVEITEFLTHLAVEGRVTASTQNQALSALLFLYQQFLKMELPRINALRATTPARLPVVLAVAEIRTLLDSVPDGVYRLMFEL